jgi:hypothetical protein
LKSLFIKAGALTYAIFIMLVTLIVIGTLITIAFYHRNYLEREMAQQKLLSYTNSVLTAAINDSTIAFPWDGKSLELSENETYQFKVIQEYWGAFCILNATGSYEKFSYQKKAFCGAKGVMNDATALYLSDNQNSIAISGNTQLTGDCYLPKAGIKASYMEGDYYRGKQLVYGQVHESAAQLPAMESSYLQWIEQLLSGKLNANDSIIDFASITNSEFINRFNQKTLCFVSTEPLYLNRCLFEENLLIVCSQPITVFPSAELNDVILVAPKITFKKNWYGAVQAYARDTLIAENDVHFQYPSVLGVKSTKNVGLIELQRNTRLDGTLWMSKNNQEKENKNTCFIHSKSYIHGLAHIEGKISLQGDVAGSLYAEKFFLKTVSSYYENHIFNVEINAYNRSPFLATAILDKQRALKLIKILEP